jgi:selT/selW/selH-like putative selenoprotein
LEADIKKSFDIEIEKIAGSGGIFTVSADDKEIFSKKKMGRFPESTEIMAKLK